jgi:hypothetical protein
LEEAKEADAVDGARLTIEFGAEFPIGITNNTKPITIIDS